MLIIIIQLIIHFPINIKNVLFINLTSNTVLQKQLFHTKPKTNPNTTIYKLKVTSTLKTKNKKQTKICFKIRKYS